MLPCHPPAAPGSARHCAPAFSVRAPHRAALAGLALAAAGWLAAPLPAQALTPPVAASAAAGLAITGFGVTPLAQLRPGEVLAFQLEGTPGAQVSLQLAGATAPLQLTETAPGRYEGEYTIRSRDRLTAASTATARLEKHGQASTATLAQSLQAGAAAPVAASPIGSFRVQGPERPQPGDGLLFTLQGRPGGQASVTLAGIAQRIALTEQRPGSYEGSYVLRRKDHPRQPLVADARLLVDRQEATRRYDAADPDGRGNVQPAAACMHCGAVTAVRVVAVDNDHPNVIGTIAGGVLGGVLGRQVGGGTGRDLATIAGAVGGAYAGNRVENNMNKKQVHRVSVQLDDGSSRHFDYAQDPGLKPGARFKVVDNALERL